MVLDTQTKLSLSREIDALYVTREPPDNALALVEQVIERLDMGEIAVVEPVPAAAAIGTSDETVNLGGFPCEHPRWILNEWIKKAILLYFRLRPIEKLADGAFCDKIPQKFLSAERNRIVPYSSVRKGAYIAPKVIIMAPSFVNIGAYVDEGAMVDSLVLVGSCARIGKNVHLGAGTIIGGVLEPPNSRPVIIEDNAFIGGNCGIYEGCLVEANAVIGAGTIITAGTPIIDVGTGEKFFGRVPQNAVIVPGGRKRQEFTLQTPLIIKYRDPDVSAKVALEESLRSF